MSRLKSAWNKTAPKSLQFDLNAWRDPWSAPAYAGQPSKEDRKAARNMVGLSAVEFSLGGGMPKTVIREGFEPSADDKATIRNIGRSGGHKTCADVVIDEGEFTAAVAALKPVERSF